jgi:hypothetical protein
MLAASQISLLLLLLLLMYVLFILYLTKIEIDIGTPTDFETMNYVMEIKYVLQKNKKAYFDLKSDTGE